MSDCTIPDMEHSERSCFFQGNSFSHSAVMRGIYVTVSKLMHINSYEYVMGLNRSYTKR